MKACLIFACVLCCRREPLHSGEQGGYTVSVRHEEHTWAYSVQAPPDGALEPLRFGIPSNVGCTITAQAPWTVTPVDTSFVELAPAWPVRELELLVTCPGAFESASAIFERIDAPPGWLLLPRVAGPEPRDD